MRCPCALSVVGPDHAVELRDRRQYVGEKRRFRHRVPVEAWILAIDAEALFSTLVSWVESGIEPDYVVASQASPARTRKICMYPDVAVYDGSGSTNDQASFSCKEQKKDDLIDALTIGKQFETSTKADTDSGPD